MNQPKIWVVIPTYNERLNIEAMIERVLATGPWNILVIDDASPDGTGAVADRLAKQHSQVMVVHRPSKQGLGPAYRHGLGEALNYGADIVVHCDADLSHPPELIPELVRRLDQADLAIASRYVAGGRIAIDWRRRWISQIGNMYIRLMLGWGIRDWSTGYKAWRGPFLQRVLAAPLRATGYACLMEMTWWARKTGARVTEAPLNFVDRTAGESKFTVGIILEDIKMAWRLRWHGSALAKSQKN